MPLRRGGTAAPPAEVAACGGAPTGGVVAGVVGVRLLKRWCSRGPTSEALLEEEDEWFPLSASAGRKGGCESSSDTRLGAGGGDGSADGSRQGAGLLGANRGRCWGTLGPTRLGPRLGPLLATPLAPTTAVAAAGAALVVVGVLTTGDGELVTAGVTGAEAADAGCGGCGSAGCHVGPLWSRATAAGDGGPRRARGGLERALGTHGAVAAEGGAEEAAAAALVVVVGVQLAVVTAVGGAAAAPAGVVVVVAAVDAGLAAAWPRLGACGGLGW